MKYTDSATVFQEVPDEITLAIDISNCPHRCKGCHSPHLREDIGTELTAVEIDNLLKKHPCVSCVCFMGGDNQHKDMIEICKYIKEKYPSMHTAVYSGDNLIDQYLLPYIDYYKVGEYQADKGGLNNSNTNQKMWKNTPCGLEDITYKFLPKEL